MPPLLTSLITLNPREMMGRHKLVPLNPGRNLGSDMLRKYLVEGQACR